MFNTQKNWQAKVEGLETRIGELESDVTASAESLTAAQNELATATETITAQAAEIETLTNRNSELETELIATNEALETANAAKESAEKSAGAKASEMLASAGHPAVEVTGSDTSANTMTRASFNAQPHIKRNAFIKAGGKITD